MSGRTCAGLLGLATVVLSPFGADAADIKSTASKDGRVTIVIAGEIEPGDADALSIAVKQANNAGKLVARGRNTSHHPAWNTVWPPIPF